MKKRLALLIAATAAASTLHAHCGSCSVSEMQNEAQHQGADCQKDALTGYFSIQKALASDKLAAAQDAASAIGDAISKSECPADSDDHCAEMSAAASAIASAKDIAAARDAFKRLSESMIAQVESHGSEIAAYKMYCPMAFKNKGAAWLQDSEELRNPYYGASMLTCGMQQDSYGPASDENASHDGHDHSGHSH